jgi:acyl-CoA synthetase (AMP-forming)/AMP-acid ligase II
VSAPARRSPPSWWEGIHQAVAGLARRCPDRPAVIDGTTTVTFGQLWQTARRPCPAGAAGPVLAIPARSDAGFFVAVVAAWLAGLAPMPLPAHAPADLRSHLRDAEGGEECQPWKAVIAVSGATYTRLLTHGEPPTQLRKAAALGLRSGTVAFFCSPMHLNGPFEFALRHLLGGGTVLVAPRFTPAIWAAMATAYRPRWAFLVPTQMRRLLGGLAPAAVVAATTSLELLVHSSEPCPAWLRARFGDLLGTHRLAEYYGTACYDGTLAYGTGGGRPIDGALLRVVDPTGRPVPPDTVGTIEGRSAAGLLSHPAGRCPGADGWQSVGDRGHLTADGRLVLDSVAAQGRAIVGGINVALARVEAVLTQHPAILGCDVYAAPDDDYGDIVAVRAYAGGPHPTVEDLQAYCATRLSSAERPRRIDVVPAALAATANRGGWS